MKTTLPPEKTGNCAAIIDNQEMEHVRVLASSKARVTARRVPVSESSWEDLNQFRKADLVLVHVM